MACTGKIQVRVDKYGKPISGSYRWLCEGHCANGKPCKVIPSPKNHHGGYREWCGCPGEPEPKECHLVLYHPGPGEGGGPPELLCAGECAGHHAQCELVAEYACFCSPDVK